MTQKLRVYETPVATLDGEMSSDVDYTQGSFLPEPSEYEEYCADNKRGLVIDAIADNRPSAYDMMELQQQSGTLEFWADPAEDIYDEEDGDPV